MDAKRCYRGKNNASIKIDMGEKGGGIKANAEYLNMVNMEVGSINAEIKELEERIWKNRWTELEELMGFYSVCPAGNQKSGPGSQETIRGGINIWNGRTAPTKKGGKKDHSTINKVVSRESTINIYKPIHGVGFEKCFYPALRELRKCAMKEMGIPDVHIETRLNKALWAKGIRNVPYRICVRLSRKCNEDDDSSNKPSTLLTYVPVTAFKNLQIVTMDEN
ncbi:PREDICTED: 60S ribosomal protein L31-like [Odobenus rosmarus divergens]|uniref:Large ribosomal subunit protein eL31 n=1 Tax=Odobenus rosmarus divergens TaxID=9708 RepID=A0A9B0GTQ0_ODORO